MAAVWRQRLARPAERLTYYLQTQSNGSQTLFISHGGESLRVEGWTMGELGIQLGAGSDPAIQPPATDRTITGDLQPVDFNPTEAGVQTQTDDLGNLIVGGEAAPNREDILYDSAGNDLINAGGGNDTVWKIRGGDDIINLGDGDDNLYTTATAGGSVTANGGTGRDYLGAGSGRDLIEGGSGADGLYGSREDDRLYGDLKGDANAFIAQGATQPGSGLQGEWFDAEDGDDQLFGGAANESEWRLAA